MLNPRLTLNCRGQLLSLEQPIAMGILNVTPDSFYDGGKFTREGAMLGVPSIYAGNRDMPANEILIRKDMLLKLEPEEVVPTVRKIMDGALSFQEKEAFRQQLYEEWDDVTGLILTKVEQSTNQD